MKGTRTLMCVICNKRFHKKANFYNHILTHKKQKRSEKYECNLCTLVFTSKLRREYHVNSYHRCRYCDYESHSQSRVESHVETCHCRLFPIQEGGRVRRFSPYPFKEIKAFRGYLQTYRHRRRRWEDVCISVVDYFTCIRSKMKDILAHSLIELKSIKLQVTLLCQFSRKEDEQGTPETCFHFVNTNQKVLLNMFYFRSTISQVIDQCLNIVHVFEQNGSGWVLDEVVGCDLKIAKFPIITGSCFIPIPNSFQYKRAIINPRNTGNDCFKWAFLTIQHYYDVQGSHRERISQYRKYENLYNFSGIVFPITMNGIKKFERQNEEKNFRINVFGYYGVGENWNLHVMYLSLFNNDKTRNIINLLHVQDASEHHAHFMCIVDIDKLLGKNNHHRHSLCYNCLQQIPSSTRMEEHESYCLSHKPQRIEYPRLDKQGEPPKLKFHKYQNKLKTQFVIYADFESILKPEMRQTGLQTEYQRHVPSGFALIAVNSFQEVVEKLVYRGEDCINVFFNKLDSLSSTFIMLNRNEVPMIPLTPEECLDYASTSYCHICGNEVTNRDKTRDHCHITGKYRGAAHRNCNMRLVQNHKIPVVMHNFKNYDQHLIITGIRQKGFTGIKTIPQNTEKFLSIICNDYVFIDSMMFLATSLDDLVKNLSCDAQSDIVFSKRFSILVQFFGLHLARKLSRKGVFPYEYIDRFSEKVFPERKHFYNTLTNSSVNDEDYNYGKSLFSELCKDLGDYHDLYMTVDTLLLACVFENFRTIALENYFLDPCAYFSLAGYAWDAALLSTKAELELITDPEMYNMIESGLRGGVSMISTRYATAYNHYMPDYKEGEEEDRYLLYIDKNDLYGEALLQPLPISDFEWMEDNVVENFTAEDVLQLREDGFYGYILSVDLEYPEALHPDHDEYPLMPEKKAVAKSELSPYQHALITHLGIQYSDKSQKLIPHLGSRTNYVVHYRNLKYYLSKGVKLTKVHKIIRFYQECWLKDYVMLNAKLRREASSEFEKSFFKFMVNSIFGKSMEQKRNRMEAVIVSNPASLKRYLKRSTFKSYQIINDNVAIVFMSRPNIILDRPIYTAFTVLDLSKLLMYEWHYDKIKAWYGDKAVFLFTDTDSLAYCIFTKDLYLDLAKRKDEFDFSDYPRDHFLHSEANKKVIGKMKDEANSRILTSFVGLAPKMYSFEGLNNLTKKAAKGVKKTIIKQKLKHSTYLQALKNQKKLYCSMNLIRSKHHKITSVSIKKVALHCFDSKRFILRNGVTTVSLNNSSIENT